ncbi:MAG: insulinase family protein, partial [Myxococcota bacterium]
GGHEKSVRGVRRETLQTLHARHDRKGNLFFGISSPHPSAELVAQLDDAFAGAPSGKRALPRLQSLRHRPGRRVRIVQRSGRNQCQLAVGTLGAAKGDPARTALIVGDYAFGGLFSSPLVQEVRGVRGWSYSAQSVLRLGQARESWTLWTHPQADRAAACAALELELMERLVACGPSAEDLQLAKRYLIGSRALDIDTAARRTELALEARYEGKPLDWPHGYEGRIRGVKRKAIQEAFERCIDPAAARITAVGDGKLLAQAFEKLPGVTHVEVVQP